MTDDAPAASSPNPTPSGEVPASPGGHRDTAEQRAWYVYDWANSAYVTTTATVLFSPYLISVARQAACPGLAEGATCTTDLSVLGVSVDPGSLPFYLVPLSTVLSAVLLPVIGALADRTTRKRHLLAGFAWAGSLAASLMYFVSGGDWQLGAVLLIVANICLASSLVVNDSILVAIAGPNERDRVSSRGWALGYLGGGLLLALNLVLVTGHDAFGLGEGQAVRLSLLSAGVWWAAFTIVPFRGLRDRPPVAESVAGLPRPPRGGLYAESFGQLAQTLRHARAFPQTLLFLAAYVFFNDGIQTVIVASSTFGQETLGFAQSELITTILLVQFVAFGGALMFGRLAGRFGARNTVLGGLCVWVVIVSVGFVMPARQFVLFLVLAVAIGLVLGGTQALTRSLYSNLVPHGREAEYFSFYQAAERGTSWLGTFVFGLVHQISGSYRPALLSLVVFFVVGGLLLSRVDMRRGIADAGNEQPLVV